jgi:integrase
VLADPPIAALDHERMRRCKDRLSRLPANMNKLAACRGRTIDEILALGLAPQSPRNVVKKWGRFQAFLGWAVAQGYLATNVAQGKKPRLARSHRGAGYDKFTDADLAALFETDFYRQARYREPFQYWLPVLGLYTGARLEELAQLHLADIRQDAASEAWYLDITEESSASATPGSPAKRLKTVSSMRACPLHRAVLEAGFLEFVAALRARGESRLFPELPLDATGRHSPRASEWFTDYRRACGVGAAAGRSRKVFHSFRHTMNATLQREGVAQELREALTGHASDAINVRVYGGRIGIARLAEAIAVLRYGVAIARYVARDTLA